ncbi:sensor histidine kinase [Streptomyces fulvoviolaceus]|uniref:sensor histidine kinase n=1 Tax=Streptomyces fulvoviolaceus TaxID=285535 RepID=UPI0021BEA6AF|nr:nitrate- and nitrite sensing domain-containing protein [Streptomyces fulvoviolaceus]MCT9083980.1 nitrate- and nitrite sensing domain-containing protein [Streptomyces fulvoviolaceus]
MTSNWRVAQRLRAIVLIPVIVTLVLGGFRVKQAVDTYREADDAVRVAELVQTANKFASDAINERDLSVVPLLQGDTDSSVVANARKITDQDMAAFDEAVERMPQSARLLRRVAVVQSGEKQLAGLREDAFTSRLPGVQTEEKYHLIQHPLMELANELGFGSSNQASFGRALYAISLTQAAESLNRAIGTHLLAEDRSSLAEGELQSQLAAFASYGYLQEVALQEFAGAATDKDQAQLQKALAAARTEGQRQVTEAAAQAEAAGETFVTPPSMTKMISEIASGKSATELAAQGITTESFFAASTLAFDAYRDVEVYLTDTALANAEDIADEARRDAVVNSAVALAAVLAAFLVAAAVARSMSTRMRLLRSSAFQISGQRLPALLAQLSRSSPGRIDTRIEPIPVDTRDEIGEVARAFDQVHREAVRLAAEQAVLRGNINAIFTNLSRRSQSLIEGQLTLITDLENNEADPDQLENLFRLDHLATRMRRNGENLLVLAGEEAHQPWVRPLPVVDVLRAASSEVEQYERIELDGIPEAEIHGRAVSDLVHLLAELLENATAFSSPQTRIRVTAARLPDGRIMIEIHDKGIGLTTEDFAALNHKLANPPTVDADISRNMGLFVVGRLADRHGIRVQLRPSREQTGTTSLVMLPHTIIQGAAETTAFGEAAFGDLTDFAAGSLDEAQQHFAALAAATAEPPTGAGFGRHEAWDQPATDPMGRFLQREELRRHAEPGAQQQQPGRG